jgi:hypothetical protein
MVAHGIFRFEGPIFKPITMTTETNDLPPDKLELYRSTAPRSGWSPARWRRAAWHPRKSLAFIGRNTAMSERGARIVRPCPEIAAAICRRSGRAGGSATVGPTRMVPYRLRRSRPRAQRPGFQSLQSSGIRSTRQFPGAAIGTDGWLKRQSGDPRKMDRDTSNRAKGGLSTRAIHVGHRPANGSGALTPS